MDLKQQITFNELKTMFLEFMRESSDDYCSKCAYCEPLRCSKGAWQVNGRGNITSNNELYATNTCIEGLYVKMRRQEAEKNKTQKRSCKK